MTERQKGGNWKVWLVLFATFVLLGLAIHNIREKSSFELLDDGVFWNNHNGRVVAKRVDLDGSGAAAGLRVGDVLVLLNDQPVELATDVRRALNESANGENLNYQILREEQQRALSLKVAPLPRGNVSVYYFLSAVGIFSLLVGTFVYVRRRGISATAHFYLFCLFLFLAFSFSFTGKLDGWDRAFFWIDRVGRLFFPPIFLHFALCFPEKKELVHRRPSLIPALYLPSAFLLYLSLTAEMVFFSNLSWGDRFFISTDAFLDRMVPAYVALVSLAAFAAFVDSYRRAPSVTIKKQTKWIVWGTGFGTLPFAMFYAVPYLIGVRPSLEMDLSAASLALIPLSFAYAIIKYRLMDIEVLFKRGMVYTLATAAVGGLYLAIFLAGAQYLVGDAHSTVLAVLSALVVVLVFTPIKSQIQTGVDRLFYRQSYDYRQALRGFSRDLNADLDLDSLSSRLVARIGDTFEVEKVALLVAAEGGELELQAERGLTSPNRVETSEQGDRDEVVSSRLSISPDSELYRRLANGEKVYCGEFDWGGLRHQVSYSEPDADREALATAGLQYVIPCVVHGKVAAAIALGRRWDLSTLSSEDMELISMLSGQAATALENARLYRSLERKAEQFETLKEQSENTIESLEAGILVLDLEGEVLRWNRALERIHGSSREDVLGRHFDEIFPKAFADALQTSMGRAWWERAEVSGISRLNLHNLKGEDKVVKLQVAPFLSEDDKTQGSIVFFEDITQRVELETQLQLHEKMASLGLLAAGVAHEVNTPLTGISSFTQMLRDHTGKNDPRSKLLEKIERQTERASKIVNNLLNFARQGRSDFVPVSLNEVIRDVLSLLEHQLTGARVKVRLELSDELPTVLGEENKLQQIFLNLILNARDSMPSGGWLTISTSHAPGETVRAVVSDTGQGISQEDIKRIYDPFFTTKRAGASGTGLGLSITYGIIQEHSGHIQVDSAIGQGTSFQITFPIYESYEGQARSSSGTQKAIKPLSRLRRRQ